MSDYLSLPGIRTREHEIEVPLVHGDPSRGSLTVYAREVAAPDGPDRPYLVYLQGGPGGEAPRPSGVPWAPGWLERALKDYRVLMLDQRGTGRSTPFGEADLRADATGDSGHDGNPVDTATLAERLTHHRADAIVADAELLREHLGVERWSLLGQSFGGFTALAYLSRHADRLSEVYFTGGLPPVGRGVDEVYARTYEALAAKSERFYRRYPGSRERMRAVLAACEEGRVRLPNGDVVTPPWFRTLGHLLGGSTGAASLAHLLEGDVRAPWFRHDLASLLPFGGRNPLYSVVHESCYADGGSTRWSAARTYPEAFLADDTLLTGEHVYPWHFEVSSELRPYAELAEAMAQVEWPRLYDADALANADVPCAAAIYARDAYVDPTFSVETADLLPRMHTWITDEYEHDGLRAGGGAVLDRLIALATDRAR
ncbi:alpha/beta fold hydrolase [Mobilicoccus sp.]|uniref:alpha/beta fold hydrolase n=1 Tax=Mobilicoccus sp. TaxID=2034349 RepID=UPI0028ADF9B1|nr:alpha/beta fold hydrolase [Mobilicoccus sp.]